MEDADDLDPVIPHTVDDAVTAEKKVAVGDVELLGDEFKAERVCREGRRSFLEIA